MAVHTVKDGTDVAMMGLWDLGLEAVSSRHSLAELEKEVVAAQLTLVRTGTDGGFDAVVAVDEELSEEEGVRMKLMDGPFLLHAPTGRLCWGSTEFYRMPKAHKIVDSQVLTVAPGDYAVRWFELVSLPRLEFEQYLGKERYALWVTTEREQFGFGCIVLVSVALALRVGWVSGWWAGLGVLAAGIAILAVQNWVRNRRDPARKQLPELEHTFAQRTGHDAFSEVEEAYLEGKPDFGIELRRQEPGAPDLVGGLVELN